MRTLQYRFAMILIVSMCAVVLVATFTTWVVFSASDATRMVEPVASQISFAVAQLEDAGTLPPMPPFSHARLSAQPAPGEDAPRLSAAFQQALATRDLQGAATVTQVSGDRQVRISYEYSSGKYLIMDYPGVPPLPPHLFVSLGLWLVLVVAGVASVALILARRVTQPFAILEKAVAEIGQDGTLPYIPEEQGSGEARHTAKVLNQLSARLRAAMDSRMRVVAAAGHDLRTPITRMRLRAEFIPKDEQDAWISDIDELELIADSAIKLVGEGRGSEEDREIALDGLVRDVAADLGAAGLSVTLGEVEPTTIKGGPLSIRRALGNLMANAATHGEGAQVSLRISNDKATIIIDDNGPGIPDALMSRVFEPFFRAAPGRIRTIKGSGLGLAIAKEIIERTGGTLTIRNRTEGGLRQTVNFDRVHG